MWQLILHSYFQKQNLNLLTLLCLCEGNGKTVSVSFHWPLAMHSLMNSAEISNRCNGCSLLSMECSMRHLWKRTAKYGPHISLYWKLNGCPVGRQALLSFPSCFMVTTSSWIPHLAQNLLHCFRALLYALLPPIESTLLDKRIFWLVPLVSMSGLSLCRILENLTSPVYLLYLSSNAICSKCLFCFCILCRVSGRGSPKNKGKQKSATRKWSILKVV